MFLQHLAGMRYANAHQSVNKGVSPKIVYKAIKDAVKNDPFRTQLKTDAKRLEAIQFGFDRIDRLGNRKSENFRVSTRDQTRIEKEFAHLKSRIQTLASAQLYPEFLKISDPDDTSSTSTRFETFRAHLNQLMDATFDGTFKQNPENMTDVLVGLKNVALGRFEGDFNEAFGLKFDGKKGWFKRNIPILRTVMDITEDISAIVTSEDDEDDAWLNSAKRLTQQMIVDNPYRALATQIDGIEETGRIFLDIF